MHASEQYTFTWYGSKSRSIEEKVENLSKEECEYMINTRLCEKKNMTCNENDCYLEDKPESY